MIVIKTLQVSSDRSQIDVAVQTSIGDVIQSVNLWTDATFKDASQAISFNNKLTGSSNIESFTIQASELGVTTLDGIYFIEFTTTNNSLPEACTECDDLTALGVTADLGYFQECLLDKILKLEYHMCDSSDNILLDKIFNIKMLIESLCISIKFGYYQNAIDSLNSLRALCDTSKKCSQCKNLHTPTFKSGLNFGILGNNLILQ